MTLDLGLAVHLSTQGADQAAAGIDKVTAASVNFEKAAVRLQKAQADLAAATQKAAAAQAAYDKAAADGGTQEKLAQAAVTLAQAQARQASAAVQVKDAQAGLQQQTKAVGGQFALTAQQAQQMSFQLNDLFVQIASGGNPMLALIQQGSQLSGTFGGLRGTVAALGTVFTPLRLLAGGTAAALGLIAIGAHTGSEESLKLARDLAITGNAAGLTEAKFNSLARTLSKDTNSSIGAAREVLGQLVSTGRFTQDALQATADTALRLAKATGQGADEISKSFVSLTDNVQAGAAALNRTYNFLTVSQLEYIRNLDQQGKSQEAVAFTMRELSARVGDQTQNLGYLERAWGAVGRAVSSTWDTIKGLGRATPVADQLKGLEARLQALQQNSGVGKAGATFEARELQRQIEALQEIVRLEQRAAEAAGQRADATRAAARALELQEGAKSSGTKLKDQLRDAESVLRLAGVADTEIKRVLGNITQTSAAFSQSMDAAFARLQAKVQITAEIAKGSLAAVQQQIATGQLSQIEGIERIATLEGEQLQREKDALVQQLILAQKKKENAAEVARLSGQVTAKQIEINNRVEKSELDVAAAIYAKRKAAGEAVVAQQQEAQQEIAADLQRQEQERRRLVETIYDQVQAVNESVEAFRLEQQLAGADEVTRNTRIGLLRIEQKLRRDIAAIQASTAISPEDKERMIGLLRETAKAAGVVMADGIANEFEQRAVGRIRDGLLDAALQGVQGLKRYLVDLFKRQAFTIFLNPVLGPIAGVLAAATGSAQASTGVAGGAQQLASYSSLYSAGQTMWQGFQSGVANTAASAYSYGAAYSGSTYGTAFGSQQSAMLAAQDAGFGTAAGGSAGAFGSAAGIAAGAVAGVYGGRAISAGYGFGNSGNSTVNAGTAIGAVVGSIFPGIGTAIGAAVGGLIGGVVNRAFGRKAPEIEGRSITGEFTGGDFTGNAVTDILEKGGWFRSDKRTQQIDPITGDLDKALDEGGKQLAELAKRYGAALGLPVERLADVTQAITVKVTDDAEENTKAIQAALGQYADALLQSFSPELEPLRRSGETFAQTIERVGGNLLQVNDLFKTLGLKAFETSVAGGDAALKLTELAGGLSALGQATGGYYAAFYTDAERAAKSSELVAAALGQVNIALPATREEFRRQVEAQDLTTEAGRKAFVTLMQVAGAFAELVPLAESAEAVVRSQADIAQERYDLETRLLQLQGDTATLRQRELDALDPTNRSLLEMIYQLEDAAAAAQGLASSAKEVASASIAGTVRGPGGQVTTETDLAAQVRLVTQADIAAAVAGYADRADRERAQSNLDVGSSVFLNALTNSIALGRIAAAQAPNPAPERISGDGGLERSIDAEARAAGKLTDAILSLRDSLTGYLDDLTLGNLSTLSPEQKYLQAKAAFDSVAKQALAGDQAAGEQVRERSQAFLQISREFNGGNGAYSTDYAEVVRTLQLVVELLDRLNGTTENGNRLTADGLSGVESATTDAAGLTTQALERVRLLQMRGVL